MLTRFLIISAALLLVPACVSNVKNPVSSEIVSTYSAGDISVALIDGKKIPDRYDTAAREYIDTVSKSEKEAFESFAAGLEPTASNDDDYTGESLLAWLIKRNLEAQIAGNLTGTTEANLEVSINSTSWPNTATMLLVGEVIGIGYEFELKDGDDASIVKSTKTISPIVQPSAGAGGGLLGMALRSGSSQHLSDLQRVASATSNSIVSILTASELPQTTLGYFSYQGVIASELEE